MALQSHGIHTVREGLRWHLIEAVPGQYNFDCDRPWIEAGMEMGIEQIIDLFHFGWPDHLDVFSPEFVSSFAQMAGHFARFLKSLGIVNPLIAPSNEISFVAWAGGDVEYLNPFQRGRGPELKEQLVRAALAATRALIEELPRVRLVWPEPVIHIEGDPQKLGDKDAAEAYRLSMYEVWDMLSGRFKPELGGDPAYLQCIGVNFYDRNQWMNHGRTLTPADPEYRPFHQILLEVWERYRVPIFVSETGAEDGKRPWWLEYVGGEVRRVMALGVPMQGLCLYPILNHPGWDDDRHCHNGMFDYARTDGCRDIYQPLADELSRQQQLQSEFYRGRDNEY